MRRREFITLAGGLATLPLSARAQQLERVRHIGMLIPFSENDPEAQIRLKVFKQSLQSLGGTEDRNVRIDYRYTTENLERIDVGAAELVALAPEVLVVYSNSATMALSRATRGIPIVFAQVSNPVEIGLVASLARPGGNITGFQQFESAIGGKWLEVLKQIAPGVRRVAVLHSRDSASNVEFLHAAEAASASLDISIVAAGVRDAAEIEPSLAAFAQQPDGGLIVAPSPATITTRGKSIIALAARLNLPAIYPFRFFPMGGGLVSYGIDQTEPWRGVASYVDRILRGARSAELPVQLPTKFELVINLTTAKALGLKIPDKLLFTADEVIE